jgi:hypothetical protein
MTLRNLTLIKSVVRGILALVKEAQEKAAVDNRALPLIDDRIKPFI